MRMKRILAVIAIMVLAVLGCSLGGSSSPEEENLPEIQNSTSEDSAETTELVRESNLFLPLDQEMEIALLTPENGNGSHPLFAWEPVAGADLYMLFLLDGDNGAYWAWEGNKTQIYLGGFETQPPPGVDGPILLEPMTWVVIAGTEDGEFVGSSQVRSISP